MSTPLMNPQKPSQPNSSMNPAASNGLGEKAAFENTEGQPIKIRYVPDDFSVGTSNAGSQDELDKEAQLMRAEEETFYSHSTNNHGDDNIWGLLSGVGGNIYEWYDFAVYGLLASEIGGCFFPQSSKEMQLIQSFGVYLAAFLMRPLGAILFGEIGDRIAGRKNALAASIILITVPSVMMGLLPTYEMWGPIAPSILVILRMAQGLSVGGQLAGSYVLSIEQSTAKNRGFRGSICDASSVGGFLVASMVTTIVRHILSEEDVKNWGWRIPFWVSLLLAPILYVIVGKTEESKLWSEKSNQKETEKIIREQEETRNPAIYDLFGSPFRRRQLFGMVGVLSSMGSSFYTIFLFVPVYLSDLRGVMSQKDADLMNFFIIIIYIACLVIGGKLSDTFPHRIDLIRIGLPGLIMAAPVMFGLFESESKVGYFIGQLQFAMCLSLVNGGMAAFEVELWMADPTLSFTGVAVGHNLASTIFSGTMPLIATGLFYKSSEFVKDDYDLWPRLVPAFYLSLLGCLSLYSISFIIRHPHDVRSGERLIRDTIEEDQRKKERKRRRKQRKKKRLDCYWPNQSGLGSQSFSQDQGSYKPPAEPSGVVIECK